MVRQALRADLDEVVDIWVDAFSADPFLRWIAPDDAAWADFGPGWLGFIAGQCFERGHLYLGDGVGIAWIPPDLALVGPDDIARGKALIDAAAGPAQGDQALDTILAARGHAMEASHWTLQYIGVRSGRRGQGLGEAVVAPRLAVIDEDGLPCGLTSSNPTNLTFYRRLGFEVTAEISTPDGAATLRPMERPAVSVSGR